MPGPSQPQLLYQDDSFCVVDKPVGWVVIPSRPAGRDPVLVDWAYQEMKKMGAGAWVVHRIDRETSGLVLFAKNADAHREASIWFEHGKIEKTYRFVAHGKPMSPVFRVATPIEEKKSITQFQVLQQKKDLFLGDARLVTGRRHQIRIHLSSLGHVIAGDFRYHAPESGFKRMALHAFRLKLPTGPVVESVWPVDLERAFHEAPA